MSTVAETQTVAVNRPPAITWHHLHMNEHEVEIPALEVLQGAAHFDMPVEVETVFDLAEAHDLESGLGSDAERWFDANAEHTTFRIPAFTRLDKPIELKLSAREGGLIATSVDIIVGEGSHADARLIVDSASRDVGLVATRVRLKAEKGSDTSLELVQTLEDTWIHLDELSIITDEDASVRVDQTVLGSAEAHMGLACNLVGARSSIAIRTHYLGFGTRDIDMGYILRQRGIDTRCDLDIDGVLADDSSKTLRGTIDLVHGCKGSVGRELETVFITGEGVSNNSLPVILCDEDDVRGDHGATIGHLDAGCAAYLMSRGLDRKAAEELFLRSSFESAYLKAPDAAKEGIDRLSTKVLGAPVSEEVSL